MHSATEATPKDGKSNTILTQGEDDNLESKQWKGGRATVRAIVRS